MLKLSIFTFVILSFLLSLSDSQGQVYTLKYDQITNFNGPDTIEAILTIDRNINFSQYTFGKVSHNMVTNNRDNQGSNISISVPKKIDTVGSYIRTDLATGHLEVREKAFGKYFLVADTTSVSWSGIMVDTVINGSDLKKTTCSFRGRDYNVSFLPDSLLHAGPWKFRGLPGLIIEVADRSNEVVFKATTILEQTKEHALTRPPQIDGVAYFPNYEAFRQERNRLRHEDESLFKDGKNGRFVATQIVVYYVEKD